MLVQSTRSQNITVTCRHSPAVSGTGAAIGAAGIDVEAGAAAAEVLPCSAMARRGLRR